MTDDEINERVARIEGWTQYQGSEWWSDNLRKGYMSEAPPPYTKNWWWCGPLIERHQISLTLETDSLGNIDWAAYANGDLMTLDHRADTPQRAICLAVIGLHESRREDAA